MSYIKYYVSGIWSQDNKIHSFFLHQNAATGFQTGVKTSVAQLVDLLKKGETIFALGWDYKNGNRFNIAQIELWKMEACFVNAATQTWD